MNQKWILAFYSIPSKPEKNRVKIYRKLQKHGALALKDGVYILPFTPDNYEFFTWLRGEVALFDGSMNFTTVEKLDTMSDDELIASFIALATSTYEAIAEKISSLITPTDEAYAQNLKKLIKEFEAIVEHDYFGSPKGKELKKELQLLQEVLWQESHMAPMVPKRDIMEYQNKIWQTRPRPFVDRMASVWLIKNFIDKEARFIFNEMIDPFAISFDMQDATISHIGDFCTFEVLLKSFSLENEALLEIAKLVHNLDINDDKYHAPHAEGIRLILSSIRETSKDDDEIIKKSGTIFDYIVKNQH